MVGCPLPMEVGLVAVTLPGNLQAALEYTTLGWSVFPLRPGSKKPLSLRGFHDATTDHQQLHRWWGAEPEAGVGIATGMVSRLVVLDVDPRNGGDETLRALIIEFGEMPTTITVETGGSGVHFYFLTPDDVGVLPGVRALWPGIDIKADGGYVAAPFSRHPSGQRYRFSDGRSPEIDLAPAPAWLTTAMKEAKKRLLAASEPKDPNLANDRIYPQGERNDILTSLTGTLHRRGMTYDAILAALLAENLARCDPPLSEGEVKKIVDSVTALYDADPDATPGVSEAAEHGTLLSMVDVVGWASTEPPPITWIIPQRLALGDCALLVGPDGCGKSWMGLDMGVAGTTGRKMLGRFKAEKPLRFLMVDEENPPDMIHDRLRNLIRAHGVSPDELDGRLFLLTPCQGFTFRDKNMITDFHRKVETIRPDVIVLDSVTALSNIDNENDAVSVRRFFHDALYPIRSICGSTILLLHHPNKTIWQDDPPAATAAVRGSIDYAAAADAVIMLMPDKVRTKSEHARVSFLTLAKMRRGKQPPDLHFRIVGGYEDGGARPMVTEVPASDD